MNGANGLPRHTLNPAIQSILDQVERNAWLVDRALLRPGHERWLRRRIAVRRAASTTRIEGANLIETQVADLLARPVTLAKLTEDQRANLNASRAYEFVDFLSDAPDLPLGELAIRELNRQFISGNARSTPGFYRSGPNYVRLYEPAASEEVPRLMRELTEWLVADSSASAFVKAAVAHIHLVAIHPFWDGNGRTARGLSTAILQRSNLHFKKLLTLEAALYRARDDYFRTLENVLGPQFRPGYDCTQWLAFLATTLRVDSEEVVKSVEDWTRRLETLYASAERLHLSRRQAEGVVLAWQQSGITPAEYADALDVAAVTASRDLSGLVARGLLEARGATRARRYVVTHQAGASLGLGPQSSV